MDNRRPHVVQDAIVIYLKHCHSSQTFFISMLCRTIVNGLCYLATFVYGFNSIGLFLYSGQLALNPIMEGYMISENKNKDEENVGSVSSVK
ncbi:hypothetical protein Gohar_014116 [Gossypium harknessii]|uniref:Uncharacterized protein n=1 Tax=Gossypium harknessii TaxID=34285 RepID=A0A7J9H2B0_9ROSI|nr:hypothetical protein [Gossypium harknessii]